MPRNSIDADQWAPRPLKTEEEEKGMRGKEDHYLAKYN